MKEVKCLYNLLGDETMISNAIFVFGGCVWIVSVCRCCVCVCVCWQYGKTGVKRCAPTA